MAGLIDVTTLLEPVGDTAEAPGVGPDPRAAPELFERHAACKDARAEARLAERRAAESGDAGDELLRAGQYDWERLLDDGAALLAQAKDLEVAAWLTEALLRLDGVAGLADGFELMGGLVERYWDDGLWPAAEEGLVGEEADEERLGALFGLFGRGGPGTLLQPLRLVPLSERADPPVTLWSAELAGGPPPPRLPDEEAQQRAEEERQAAIDAVANGISRSGAPFIRTLRDALRRAAAALEALMAVIDARTRVGRFGSQIAAPLEAALALVEAHGAALLADEENGDAAGAGVPSDAPRVAGAPGGARGPIGSREEAFAAVLAAAAFLEKQEPQSMTPDALRDVVRRARMPLAELLAELLPDGSARDSFLMRAGIKAPEAADGSY